MLSLGDRMKSYYEDVARIYLTRRTPVIIRVDGKAFHTLTRKLKLKKPFDENFISCMTDTACGLCSEIQGAKIAYVQSDEISILVTDYDNLETDAWFGYNLQKIVSVSSSIATARFNGALYNRILRDTPPATVFAYFDARAFNIPREEVANYFHWRQVDAIRNSTAGLAQSHFSHKELHKKNVGQMREVLVLKDIYWERLATWLQRGICITKKAYTVEGVEKTGWDIDQDIPLFSEQRDYIEQYI